MIFCNSLQIEIVNFTIQILFPLRGRDWDYLIWLVFGYFIKKDGEFQLIN